MEKTPHNKINVSWINDKSMALVIREAAQENRSNLTKIGGIPLASANTQWPRCRICGGWMQFICQISLEKTAIPELCERKQLLLIFMCANDPGMCDDGDAESGGNVATLVPKSSLVSLEVPHTENVLLSEETQVSLDSYDDSADAYCELFNSPEELIHGKIGGEPLWIQADETPTCKCGKKMTFVLQLSDSGGGGINFGDAGAGYGFVCSGCNQSAKFLWQCH